MTRVLDPETIAARLADLPTPVPALELLVLFGSTVKGRARPRSDVDLAVRCEGAADLDALQVLVAAKLGTDRAPEPRMSSIDAAIIRRKLGRLIAALEGLGPLAGLSLDDYRSRLYERKAAERLLQEAIEAALDINAHVIAELSGDVPEDSHQGFTRMAALGVLSADLAHGLAPSAAGLRNRLVHEYDALDDAKVRDSIGVLLALYPATSRRSRPI